MSTTKYFFSYLALIVLFVLASVGSSRAIPVSGNTAVGPTRSDHTIIGGQVDITETVSYDRNAGPWLKVLTYDPQASNAIAQFSLHESITIAGPHEWTDWHEEIITPGWEWGAIQFDILDAAGASILSNFVMDVRETVAWFFFDKAPRGSTLQIWKEIVCSDPCTQPLLPTEFVQVIEFPTVAEPQTIGLLGLSLIALGLYRRKMVN